MKYPKKMRAYCPYCNKHTEHTVQRSKNKPRRKMAEGQRRFLRKMKGYHSFPKEKPTGREKPTRRTDLRFKCSVCNKLHTRGSGIRSKKFELKGQ
jgi:large subunit ribosomal protein L44e